MAYALLGVPAHELTDRRVELSDLVTLPGHPCRSFGSRARGTAGDAGTADALEAVLVALWTRADPERSVLRIAARLDRAARRGLGARRTAELHGMSERSLRRLSNRLFGYGPKTLAQIHRFQRALHLARTGMPLSDSAATAGYADQAHFNRESKRLTGRTPAALTATGSAPGRGTTPARSGARRRGPRPARTLRRRSCASPSNGRLATDSPRTSRSQPDSSRTDSLRTDSSRTDRLTNPQLTNRHLTTGRLKRRGGWPIRPRPMRPADATVPV